MKFMRLCPLGFGFIALASAFPAAYHAAPVRRHSGPSAYPLYGSSANSTFVAATGTAYSSSSSVPVPSSSSAPCNYSNNSRSPLTTLTTAVSPSFPTYQYASKWVSTSPPDTAPTTPPQASSPLSAIYTIDSYLSLTSPLSPWPVTETPAPVVPSPPAPYYLNGTSSVAATPVSGTGTGYHPPIASSTATTTSNACTPASYRCSTDFPSYGWDVCNVFGVWEHAGDCDISTLCVTDPDNLLPYCQCEDDLCDF